MALFRPLSCDREFPRRSPRLPTVVLLVSVALALPAQAAVKIARLATLKVYPGTPSVQLAQGPGETDLLAFLQA